MGIIARSSNRGATFSPSCRVLRVGMVFMKRKPKALSVEVGDRALANASFQGSKGEIGSKPEAQGILSPEGGVKGENIEKAREEVGVVGNRLPGVVGADESSSFRLEVMGAKCLREVVTPTQASEESDGAEVDSAGAVTLNLADTGEVAESEDERRWDGALGSTGSSANGAGFGSGSERRREPDGEDTVRTRDSTEGTSEDDDAAAEGAVRTRLSELGLRL